MSLVVLISGRGSNLQALVEAGLPVVVVISNQPNAAGLEFARKRGIADGDLGWINGARGHELATAIIDNTLPRGGVVVRDVASLAPTEIVRLLRVDDERPLLNPPPV